jgi:hypothetical protein
MNSFTKRQSVLFSVGFGLAILVGQHHHGGFLKLAGAAACKIRPGR